LELEADQITDQKTKRRSYTLNKNKWKKEINKKIE